MAEPTDISTRVPAAIVSDAPGPTRTSPAGRMTPGPQCALPVISVTPRAIWGSPARGDSSALLGGRWVNTKARTAMRAIDGSTQQFATLSVSALACWAHRTRIGLATSYRLRHCSEEAQREAGAGHDL